jgi:XRE family transcriptional regulator, thiamine biosynthesis regulator
LQPPDELMTQVFLPSLRQLVASRLRGQGLSQNRIASVLGLTQASVSMYLSSDPRRAYDSLSTLNVSRPDADRYAEQLCSAVSRSATEGVRTLTAIWTGLLGSGSVCEAHRALHPSLAGCDVCLAEYGGRRVEIEQAVQDVSEAVMALEGSRDFVAVMPEVSVNVACASKGAMGPSDVVAIPGRIVKVRGRAKALLPPEAGASAHMSKVLLLVMSHHPELRACINLRYDHRMERTLTRLGVAHSGFAGSSQPRAEDPTVAALEKSGVLGGKFAALVEQGGGGIEPNVYIFGRSAKEAADLAVKVARAFSAG